MPKLLIAPYVKTETIKKATATIQPQPPSGTSEYTLGPRQPPDLKIHNTMITDVKAA